MKRRLADSKVVSESARFVELNVKPATKAWSKGKNLGLAIMVDDQEGTILKPSKYFKGASCMVGTCECGLTLLTIFKNVAPICLVIEIFDFIVKHRYHFLTVFSRKKA